MPEVNPPVTLDLFAADESAMEGLGRAIAQACGGHGVVFLHGDLGAGKTTLSRAMLRGLGHEGVVKSPTFTVVEPYRINGMPVYHFDLYRLADPEELEFLGIRDYFNEPALYLIEWPERGVGILPKPDLDITITPHAGGRALRLRFQGTHGESWSAALTQDV